MGSRMNPPVLGHIHCGVGVHLYPPHKIAVIRNPEGENLETLLQDVPMETAVDNQDVYRNLLEEKSSKSETFIRQGSQTLSTHYSERTI